MDAGVVDEVDDGPIALLVLVAQVLSQVDEQLSAHGLVAVHVGHIFKLRLTCEEQKQHFSDYLKKFKEHNVCGAQRKSTHTCIYSVTHLFIHLYAISGTLGYISELLMSGFVQACVLHRAEPQLHPLTTLITGDKHTRKGLNPNTV